MMNKARLHPLRMTGLLLLTACALEGTAEPPMPVDKFDPSKALEAARSLAGPSTELLEFEARFVRSDGTMDLTAPYHPAIEYKFVRPNTKAEAAPVGTGTKNRAFEVIKVKVSEPKWVNRRSFGGCSGTFRDRGMKREVSQGGQSEFDGRAPAPTCSLAEVWAAARKQAKLPDNAVAVIEFGRDGYEFSISDLNIKLWFTPSCDNVDEKAFVEQGQERRRSPEERVRIAEKRLEDEREAKAAERKAATQRVVHSMSWDFRKCLQLGLKKNGTVVGKILLTIRVGAGGEALSVTPSVTGNMPESVVSCAVARAQKARFDPPEGGSAVVEVPITLNAPASSADAPKL